MFTAVLGEHGEKFLHPFVCFILFVFVSVGAVDPFCVVFGNDGVGEVVFGIFFVAAFMVVERLEADELFAILLGFLDAIDGGVVHLHLEEGEETGLLFAVVQTDGVLEYGEDFPLKVVERLGEVADGASTHAVGTVFVNIADFTEEADEEFFGSCVVVLGGDDEIFNLHELSFVRVNGWDFWKPPPYKTPPVRHILTFLGVRLLA